MPQPIDPHYVAQLEAAYVRSLHALLRLAPEFHCTKEFINHALFSHALLKRPWFDEVVADTRKTLNQYRSPL